jgi:hypothetical protein
VSLVLGWLWVSEVTWRYTALHRETGETHSSTGTRTCKPNQNQGRSRRSQGREFNQGNEQQDISSSVCACRQEGMRKAAGRAR